MNGGTQAEQEPRAEASGAVASGDLGGAARARRTLPRTRTLSLRSYLARLIGVCLVPMLVLAGSMAANDVREQVEMQDRVCERALKRLAHEVEDDLTQRIHALEMLAALPFDDDAAGHERLYREALAYRETYGSHVILADAALQMLFHTRRPWGSALPRLPRPTGRSAASSALASGRAAVGDLVTGPVAGEALVAIAVPLRRAGRDPLLLLTVVAAHEFRKSMDHAERPQGIRAALLDGTGQVIAEAGQPAGTEAVVPGARAAEVWHRLTEPLTLAPWSVALEIERSRYEAPIREAAVELVLELAGAGLAALSAGQFASWRLSTAVSGLTATPLPSEAGAAGPGGDAARSPVSGIREIDAARALLDRAGAERAAADAKRSEVQQALAASNQQLQRLVAALHTAQEDERRRIARDVHDELQQRLAAIRIEVSTLGEGPPRTPDVSRLDGLVVDAIDATRRIVQDLRPQALDELGLPAALAEMLSRFGGLSGIATDLDLLLPEGDEDLPTRLSPAVGTCLYRIAQEALNNVRKHSGAGFVHLCLDLRSADRAELLVSDDGRGVPAGNLAASGSFGLRGMDERVRALGGELQVRPLAAGGTLVHASVPL